MLDVEVSAVEARQERRTFAAPPPEGARIIDGDARLIDARTGAVLGLHVASDGLAWADDLTRSLRGIKSWAGTSENGSEVRLSGFNNANRTFGFSAPVPLRRRYGCSVCEFDRTYPRVSERLAEFAASAWATFQRYAPAEAEAHAEIVRAVDAPWWFGGTPWTSGIINRTSALPYHRDSGNLKGSWSAMLGLRSGIGGGLLHIAEYDIWLAIPDRSLTLFDGQGALHAVTPLHRSGAGAYRFTVVVYAKSGMRKCLTGNEEIRRAQRRRTDSEDAEAERLAERRRS